MTSKPRRSKGDGSVFKSGDRWVGYVSLPDGTRKYFYSQTKAKVNEKVRNLRIRLERGGVIADDKRTTGQYLRWWIEDQRAHLARETWRGYESKVRLHLIPKLDHVRLAKLSPLHVHGMLNETAARPDVSSRHLNNIYDVLHAALEDARQMELIDRNPASLVQAPKIKSRKRKALTVEQANMLLATLKGDRMEMFYRLLLTLGLRPGEAMGLLWENVDLTQRTARIETTLQRHEAEWVVKDTPKNEASEATLPLPAFLASGLLLHRQQQVEERKAAGSLWEDWGLVFTRPSGKPLWNSDANRYLARMCKRAKVPVVTMHELRHSTPSILLSLGVDQRVIMRVLRHSTIVLTANLYTHVVNPLVKDAMDQIDTAFGNGSEK